jgi:hypothetical protein
MEENRRGGGGSGGLSSCGRRAARHVGVPGGDEEREGGREEADGWASPWDGPHLSAKRGERERNWQVGLAAI